MAVITTFLINKLKIQNYLMNLIIVESPTKAKTISYFVDKKYQVISSYGHIRDLPKGELGIDLENNFQPKYIIPTKARKQVTALKKSAQKADLIILATDQDREGEAIAWHIGQILKLGKDKPSQRIAFHEITKSAIEQALANPEEINKNLVDAQQARRILDRLVGYKLSPFLWKKIAKGLSAGRVQSVAVRLIVDREREIEKFKPEEYWSIRAKLKKTDSPPKQTFLAQLVKQDGKNLGKLEIKNQAAAKQIVQDLKGAIYQIIDLRKKQIQKNPYPPFTTSALQQEAAKKLGFPSKMTMGLAQQLYEGVNNSAGLITYHRTDSLNLSNQATAQAREYIQKKLGDQYALASPRIFKKKTKGAQEAHEAIRPTDPWRQPEDLSKTLNSRQHKLYQLIWSRFIACQMAPALLDTLTAEIQAKNCLFRANGSTIKFDGFLKIYPLKLKQSFLPELAKNQILDLIKIIPEQHFTQPPARYNEASLIKTLEEYGIGRPSTYAPIIVTIQARNYTQKNEQKKFFPTEIGIIVTDLLLENFPNIVDIKFTAQMEADLDKIAQGGKSWRQVIESFYRPFSKNLEKKYQTVAEQKIAEPTNKKCPQCGAAMVIKLGRFGKFYACSKFPECKHTEPINNSTDVKCPKCQQGEIVERKSKKGRTFYSCSRYPKCDYALWDKPISQKCPECGSLLVQKKGQTKCSNKECEYRA